MRMSWDNYFMEIATVVAKRSTCLRRQVGSVIVKNNMILSTGYNGVPINIEHCETKGCLRKKLNIPSGERHDICRAVHSEQNAIIFSAKIGMDIKGATIYTNTFPCSLCSKIIINSGIIRIVYKEGYPDNLSKELLTESKIIIDKIINP